jgi:hypothetical protein
MWKYKFLFKILEAFCFYHNEKQTFFKIQDWAHRLIYQKQENKESKSRLSNNGLTCIFTQDMLKYLWVGP